MAMVQSSRFGSLLRRGRHAAGLTQEELAEQAGLSVRAISDIERGVRHPRRDTVEMLLDALPLSEEERARFEAALRGALRGVVPSPSVRPLQTGSFLGAVPPGPLIGRKRELHRILAEVETVLSGGGRLLMLTGEPGVGKTRLAQEIALEMRERGFLVATGRCYEQEQTTPYYPFVEALAPMYATIPPSIRDEIPQRWPYLSLLLPDEQLSFSTQPGGGKEEQHRLLLAVSGFVRAVAEAMPFAVLLDDLHWADSASLSLFLHLVRHTRDHRVLLLGTYRDVELDRHHPLDRALVDLNRERLVDRVVLHRPSQQDTAALIAATVGEVERADDLTALVHEITDGNPFFVQEVLRALVERGDIYPGNGRWALRDIREIRVPESVHSAIGERLSRLRPGTQAVLNEASVLGQTFTFDDLLVLGQHREEEVEEALEEAAGAGLVREAGQDDYSFVHALTHKTLYTEMPGRRRRRLHLAIGASMEQLPERLREQRVAELAWHFREGDDAERALRYAMLAGDRALDSFAYGEAEQHYRGVAELAPMLMDTGGDSRAGTASTAEAEAHAKLGRVLNITERYDDALAALEQAAALFRRLGDVEREAAMVTEIGWVHSARGTPEDGIDRIHPFVTAVQEENDPRILPQTLAGLYTALARLQFALGLYHQELEAADQAAELGRGSDVMVGTAEARRGAALINLGRRQEARSVLERAVSLSSAGGNLGTASQALEYLGEISRDMGEFLLGRAYFERSRDVAEQTHVPSRVAWMTCKVAHISFLLGDWEDAHRHFELAADIYATMETLPMSAHCPPLAEQLALAEGRWEQAERCLNAIIATAHPKRDVWILRYAHMTLAEKDLLGSRADAARARLESLLGSTETEGPMLVRLLPYLAQAYVQLDEEHRAEKALEVGMARAEAEPHLVASMHLLRIRGMLRARQRKWEDARRDFEEAIARARSCPYPYDEARSLYELGLMYAGAGQREQSQGHLQEALVIFQRLEARPYLERTRQALTDLQPAVQAT